ncbi:hypothetical protein CS022_04540 [Veronia nyctiphanis]|uniref:Uncharacterized protein n=1 Tax=Veronia nyctiphanis TaxID=1278244 RepID=A0A4Q0YU85_9GAMM|nr:hypothetical protein [Veronia nyctiphanis]RXJ74323.1 hypothetical protein CS022_04540 [Veronia nyctiphanis]
MLPKIGDYNFGETYGENEVLYLDNFEKYFYNINNSKEKILNKKKFVVVGRKGTGKTLLANVMCSELKDTYSIAEVESLKDFVFHELYHFQGEDISSTKYVPIFEWMIYINIAKNIICKESDFSSNKITELRDFLSYFGYTSGDLKPEKTIELTRKFNDKNSASIKGGFFNVTGGNGTESVIKESARSYLENLEPLKSFINGILKESLKPSIVFYDE